MIRFRDVCISGHYRRQIRAGVGRGKPWGRHTHNYLPPHSREALLDVPAARPEISGRKKKKSIFLRKMAEGEGRREGRGDRSCWQY